MPAVVDLVVAVSATITATAATAAAKWIHDVAEQVERNTERSKTNKEIQRGTPEVGEPILDRLDRLEERR